MKVGIIGAGSIAKGYAAYLQKNGHSPSLWSPSGESAKSIKLGKPIVVSGAFKGEYLPHICAGVEELMENDVIIFALPAYAYLSVTDKLVSYFESRHVVIFSGHLSFAALYLSKVLASRGLQLPIAAWNTTALTAKTPNSPDEVRVGMIRPNIDMSVTPARLSEKANRVCFELFGDVFSLNKDIISITISNLNPQVHLALAITNLTRIEREEDWCQNTCITPAVANYLEALDRERLIVAKACGLSLPTMRKTMAKGLNVKEGSLKDLYKIKVKSGSNPLGPKDINTRYITEDVPYGLMVITWLAKRVGVKTPLHSGGIELLNACCERDFLAENSILSTFEELSLEELKVLTKDGYQKSLKASDVA